MVPITKAINKKTYEELLVENMLPEDLIGKISINKDIRLELNITNFKLLNFSNLPKLFFK